MQKYAAERSVKKAARHGDRIITFIAPPMYADPYASKVQRDKKIVESVLPTANASPVNFPAENLAAALEASKDSPDAWVKATVQLREQARRQVLDEFGIDIGSIFLPKETEE